MVPYRDAPQYIQGVFIDNARRFLYHLPNKDGMMYLYINMNDKIKAAYFLAGANHSGNLITPFEYNDLDKWLELENILENKFDFKPITRESIEVTF